VARDTSHRLAGAGGVLVLHPYIRNSLFKIQGWASKVENRLSVKSPVLSFAKASLSH